MSEGIIILFVAAIGVGYILYQKFRPLDGHNAIVERGSRAPAVNTPTVNNPVQNRALIPASRDNITETGPMIYFVNERHGRNDREYRFNYKKVGGGWRAYILRTPSLNGRDTGSAVIHRLQDAGGYYICWDSEVTTLKDIQNISRHWADSIQAYISTGRRFG